MNGPDLTLIFLVVTSFAAGLSAVMMLRGVVEARGAPVRRRLAKIAGPAESDPSPARTNRLRRRHRTDSRLVQRMTWAGLRGKSAVPRYFAAKAVLALFLGSSVLVYDSLQSLDSPTLVALVLLMTAIGWALPSFWLDRRIRARTRAIAHPLPDALDLLVSCVEAGLSVSDALARVAQEMRLPAPLLSRELTLTLHEIEAGLPRSECFRRLADRTGVTELRSLAAVLVQTEMFGTAVGRGLRILADGLRVDRLQRANERAATVGVRLTLPLILCLLPALASVLLGSAIVRIARLVIPLLRSAQ